MDPVLIALSESGLLATEDKMRLSLSCVGVCVCVCVCVFSIAQLNCSIIFFLPNLSKSPQSVISFPQKTTTSPEVEILKSHALYLWHSPWQTPHYWEWWSGVGWAGRCGTPMASGRSHIIPSTDVLNKLPVRSWLFDAVRCILAKENIHFPSQSRQPHSSPTRIKALSSKHMRSQFFLKIWTHRIYDTLSPPPHQATRLL